MNWFHFAFFFCFLQVSWKLFAIFAECAKQVKLFMWTIEKKEEIRILNRWNELLNTMAVSRFYVSIVILSILATAAFGETELEGPNICKRKE